MQVKHNKGEAPAMTLELLNTNRGLLRKRLEIAESSGAARFVDRLAREPKGTVVNIEAVVTKKLQHNPVKESLVDVCCFEHFFVH